ncbi:hypothetical protein SDC9_109636 [bioreactor metagenome]|uniref:Uncharacterized protein n=1 Tax=bioreactor metagenome TaxID=1076179 RepID=A0A645BBB1_9ZZZZ
MALGHIAERREAPGDRIEIDRCRRQISIDQLHQLAGAVIGVPAQHRGEFLLRRGDGGAFEPAAKMIGDAGFARRIDLLVGQFRDEHARFHAATGAHLQQFGRRQKFIHAVKHVEIDQPDRVESHFLRQINHIARRVAVAVVRKKAVAMEVVNVRRGRALHLARGNRPRRFLQRGPAHRRIEIVQFLFPIVAHGTLLVQHDLAAGNRDRLSGFIKLRGGINDRSGHI